MNLHKILWFIDKNIQNIRSMITASFKKMLNVFILFNKQNTHKKIS